MYNLRNQPTHPTLAHFLVVDVSVVNRNSQESRQDPDSTDQGVSIEGSGNKVKRGNTREHRHYQWDLRRERETH